MRDRVFDWPSTAEFISVDADVPEEWGDNRDLNGRQLILKIDRAHEGPNLSSAIRLFVLDYYWRTASR